MDDIACRVSGDYDPAHVFKDHRHGWHGQLTIGIVTRVLTYRISNVGGPGYSLRRDELMELRKRLPSCAIFCGMFIQRKFIKNNPDLSKIKGDL